MSGIFGDLDPLATAVALAAAMVAAWRIGLWRGRALTETGVEGSAGKFEDASMALLGLLLAFTFSLALSKHERRREALVADSNAIGDFYTCASLLPDPIRTTLQDVVRDYATSRLAAARLRPPILTEQVLKGFTDMQGRMTELVRDAVREGTPIAVPLTNTLNGLTSAHAERLSAVRDQLPWSVVLLLFLAAAVTTFLIGRQQASAKTTAGAGTLSFVLLVTLVVYLTLDLDHPSRGLISVSQEPLERLIATMAK